MQYFYINIYTHTQEQDAHHKHTGTKSVSMYTQSGFDFVTHYHMLAWRTATFRSWYKHDKRQFGSLIFLLDV